MKRLTIIAIAALMYGCGGGGGSGDDDSDSPSGVVSFSCVDFKNGDESVCNNDATSSGIISSAHAATTIVDSGIIHRDADTPTTAKVSIVVENDSIDPFTGYLNIWFDTGCDGNSEPWRFISNHVVNVEPMSEWDTRVGAMCDTMELGHHTITATLHGADPATILDTVIVHFELVE